MSKLADRAAAYFIEALPLLDGDGRDFWQVHLSAFAAREVARVDKAQADARLELSTISIYLGRSHVVHDLQNAAAITRAIENLRAATRPEKPERAKRLPSWCANPRHGHQPHINNGTCNPPKPGLSSLARTAKRKGSK